MDRVALRIYKDAKGLFHIESTSRSYSALEVGGYPTEAIAIMAVIAYRKKIEQGYYCEHKLTLVCSTGTNFFVSNGKLVKRTPFLDF